MTNTINTRDAHLVAWLGEAYAKESELEADLTAHIALTEKDSYKKRLKEHLKETREHKRMVERRIKALGGKAVAGPEIPLVPDAVDEIAGKAVAAVKGQIAAGRALITRQAETHVRNAQEELREEHVEIAIYTRIETFATEVGDTETAKLAKTIRRDEERMAKYLSAELPRLVKALVKAEIPRELRSSNGASSSRRSSTRPARGRTPARAAR
jgi:ferritin-like metal-binding protein YciE